MCCAPQLLVVKAVLASLILCFLIPLIMCLGTRRNNIAVGKGDEKLGYKIWKFSRRLYLNWIQQPFSVPMSLYGCWCCTHIIFCIALMNYATGSWKGPFDTSRTTVNFRKLCFPVLLGSCQIFGMLKRNIRGSFRLRAQ